MAPSPQGFLDLPDETDTPPDTVDDPTINGILTAVVPRVSGAPESIRFGSTPVNPGTSIKLVNADPSRARALVGVSALGTGIVVTTLAYVSDRQLDGQLVGGARYVQGVQLPVINSGSDYLEVRSTSELWVTVPATAANIVYVSFITESFSEA